MTNQKENNKNTNRTGWEEKETNKQLCNLVVGQFSYRVSKVLGDNARCSTDAGFITWCGQGFFFHSQLSVQTHNMLWQLPCTVICFSITLISISTCLHKCFRMLAVIFVWIVFFFFMLLNICMHHCMLKILKSNSLLRPITHNSHIRATKHWHPLHCLNTQKYSTH